MRPAARWLRILCPYDTTAAMAKYWLTDCQCRIVDECVQLHGGYGYMTEYPIARMWADSRVQRIYAGTNEIMKEMIACALSRRGDRERGTDAGTRCRRGPDAHRRRRTGRRGARASGTGLPPLRMERDL